MTASYVPAPNERTALTSRSKASKSPQSTVVLAVGLVLASFWFCHAWWNHHLNFSRTASPPVSLADERWPRSTARCVTTPYEVCDKRVTVSRMGPEQGCFGPYGDDTTGKFFVSSFHTGTSNEMAWLSDKLGWSANIGGFCAHIEASKGSEENPYVFTNDRVNKIWHDKWLAQRLESYAGVISTDTSHAMYPFLQNPAFDNKPLIIWVTNRFDITNPFDVTMPEDSRIDYLRAIKNASCCRKNVYFVAAHDAEIEFAKVKYPNIDVSRWRTIYPIGHESKWLQKEIMAEHTLAPDSPPNLGNLQVTGHFQLDVPKTQREGLDLSSEPFKSEALCIYPSNNEPALFADGRLKEYGETLASSGIRYNDSFDSRGPKAYGGARGMSIMCKGILHVPYAPNTMALWENVQMGNIFFLPTAKLLAEWRNSDMISVFQMSHGLSLDRPLAADFLNRTEWYREDRHPLFVYFNSPEDLVAKFKSLDFEKKRQEMRAYMDIHEAEQLAKWKGLFSEVYARDPAARILRPPDTK